MDSAYGFFTGRFKRKLFPIGLGAIIADVRDALRFRLSHDDITHYNAVQKLLYAGIIAVIFAQVISGLAVWKPMQFSELTSLFSVFHESSFQGARIAHFIGMSAIVVFLVIHLTLALLVPRTIGAMVTGGPLVDDGSGEPTDADFTAKPIP